MLCSISLSNSWPDLVQSRFQTRDPTWSPSWIFFTMTARERVYRLGVTKTHTLYTCGCCFMRNYCRAVMRVKKGIHCVHFHGLQYITSGVTWVRTNIFSNMVYTLQSGESPPACVSKLLGISATFVNFLQIMFHFRENMVSLQPDKGIIKTFKLLIIFFCKRNFFLLERFFINFNFGLLWTLIKLYYLTTVYVAVTSFQYRHNWLQHLTFS